MSKVIYEFVHSMTMREKAYFKRFSNMYSDDSKKNYLILFEYLENAPTYDKEAIKKHFSGSSIGKYLSSEMNYLLEQLLNSAINFHFNSSPNRKLVKLLLYIDLLSEKGFRRKAKKIMVQAKKLAYRHEDFAAILKLIQMEEDILFSHGILNFTQQLEQLEQEREDISRKIQNANALRLLREQVRELQFTQGFITDTTQYSFIYQNPLLENETNALSLTAKENWYYIQGLKYYLTRQYKASQLANREHLRFFATYAQQFRQDKMLPALSNYIFLSALVRDVQGFQDGMNKLRALESDKTLDQHYIKYIKYARLFEWYYQHNNLPATRALLSEAGHFFLDTYETLGSAEVDYLVRQLARASILCQEWSTGVDWVSFWHKIKKSNHGMRIIHHFTMIIYYELNYWELLESQLTASSKALKKHQKFGELERSLLSFFKRMLLVKNNREVEADQMAKLEDQLLKISKNKQENEAFEFFRFHEWSKQKRIRLR